MASLQQIEANRRNAQKSTGPRSVEGKAVSSLNALKLGIDSQSLLIRGESAKDLESLAARYYERFQPATPEECYYVDTLIRGDWQLRRLSKVDTSVWNYTMADAWRLNENHPLGHCFSLAGQKFLNIQRRIDAAERSYQRALHELERLQTARREAAASEPDHSSPQKVVANTDTCPQIGFVPQKEVATPQEPAAPIQGRSPHPPLPDGAQRPPSRL